jgi:hypothetical protein
VKERFVIFTIGVALAVFLTGSAWIITKYRIHKLIYGDKEVILTTKGAFVGSQFHTWSPLGTFLSEVHYYSAGEYEHCAKPIVRITYSAITGTIITPYTIVIVVPAGMEERAQSAVEILQSLERTGAPVART